jgi:hypothetical protein
MFTRPLICRSECVLLELAPRQHSIWALDVRLSQTVRLSGAKRNQTTSSKTVNLMSAWKPTSPTWIDRNTKVICQGFTGKQASILYHT